MIEKQKTQTKQYFYQKDQLGSIIAITDQSGKLAEEYKYDEFGKAYTRAGKSENRKVFKKSDIGNTRLFTGREYDGEIGLYYYRARYYSADLGRFISRDPIGTADNVNLYSYVGNSPVGFVDPMGREKKLATQYDATDLILSLFNKSWNFMDSLQYADPSILAPDDWHVQDWSPILMGLFSYYTLGKTDYNIKVNPIFIDPELWVATTINWQKFLWFNGKLVSLDSIWNLIYWYNGQKIGFNYDTVEWWAYTATLLKFPNGNNALLNEIPDRILYRAGYELWNNTSIGALTRENISTYLNPSYDLSRIIERDLHSPIVNLEQIQNRVQNFNSHY